jgi:hypothetical protein
VKLEFFVLSVLYVSTAEDETFRFEFFLEKIRCNQGPSPNHQNQTTKTTTDYQPVAAGLLYKG